MSDENKKVNNTVVAIALALITSFTSWTTAYITRNNTDKSNVVTKENFDSLVKAIKMLDERSLVTYMSLSEEEFIKAKRRLEYQSNFKTIVLSAEVPGASNSSNKSLNKSFVRVPEVEMAPGSEFLDSSLSGSININMREMD